MSVTLRTTFGEEGPVDAAGFNAGHALPPRRPGAQSRLRALQADIIELIVQRELEPGDPLPSEADLAAVLGTGRNTLREALKVLQALGMIEIRHGFGMFVAAGSLDALAEGLTFRALLSLRRGGREALELVEARRLLESGLVAASVAAATPALLARLEDAVRRIEELARSGEHFGEADAEFHRRLFEPLDNRLIEELVIAFRSVYRRIERELGGDDAGLPAAAAVHREVYDAVAAGDAVLAAERLGRLFYRLRDRIEASAEE